MFALLLLIIPNHSSGRFPDPCNLLHPLSYCLQSNPKPGFCSGDLTMSCHEAYDRVSAPMLRPANEPPVLAKRTALPGWLLTAQPPLSQSDKAPGSVLSVFFNAAEDWIENYRSDFPFMRFRKAPAARLERAARAVVNSTTNDIWRFRKHIYNTRMYSEIPTLLVMGLNFIYATDPITRRGVLANYIPYLHSWLSVCRIIGLPSPFSEKGYLELLTNVAEYEPFFASTTNKFWTLEFPDSRSMWNELVLPFILPLDVDDILLRVSDYFNDANVDARSLMIRAQAAFQFNPRDPQITNLLRTSLVFSLYQQSVNLCAGFERFWMDVFSAMPPASRREHVDNLMRLNLLQLFRICGKQYMDVEFRVRTVLTSLMPPKTDKPLAVNVCFGNGTFVASLDIANRLSSIIALNLIHTIHLVCNDQMLFTNFLSAFVANITTPPLAQLPSHADTLYFSSPDAYAVTINSLTGFGIAIGLLVVAGDPFAVLENSIRQQTIPNYYLDSQAIRGGFCLVIECAIFDTLFDNHEIPQVISIIRDHNVLRHI